MGSVKGRRSRPKKKKKKNNQHKLCGAIILSCGNATCSNQQQTTPSDKHRTGDPSTQSLIGHQLRQSAPSLY